MSGFDVAYWVTYCAWLVHRFNWRTDVTRKYFPSWNSSHHRNFKVTGVEVKSIPPSTTQQCPCTLFPTSFSWYNLPTDLVSLQSSLRVTRWKLVRQSLSVSFGSWSCCYWGALRTSNQHLVTSVWKLPLVKLNFADCSVLYHLLATLLVWSLLYFANI